ncbi:hypothetical protein [Sphingobium aquiterrae]|uniref:hypothetical protein n=1 Tax=Sphingobium aquiterrae TaxID=2038656 RepID=UPI003019E516
MAANSRKPGFATRPIGAERWIKAKPASPPDMPDAFSARLTIDVTPAMRRRLKLTAVAQGTSVADMLRALFAREFPDPSGENP